MKGVTLWIGFVLVGLACDISQHCDANQTYANHACYDVPQGGMGGVGGAIGSGPGGSQGAGAGGSGGDALKGSCTMHEGFGVICTMVSDCSCGLDSCNTFMGNYCTHTHCLADPSICPGGWTCLDVTAFDPTMGSVCVRP